jgi:methionine aminopeptidase
MTPTELADSTATTLEGFTVAEIDEFIERFTGKILDLPDEVRGYIADKLGIVLNSIPCKRIPT